MSYASAALGFTPITPVAHYSLLIIWSRLRCFNSIEFICPTAIATLKIFGDRAMKPLTPQDILKRYSKHQTGIDSPGSFYSPLETEVMMRANPPLKPEILTAIPAILTDKNQKPQLPATPKTPYQPIDTAFNLETALQPFHQAKIIGIDCETIGLDPYQAKIRLLQLAIPGHPAIVVDLWAIKPSELESLRLLLASPVLKVGHNLKFEWQMLTFAGLEPSKPFFDTYLAYRVLTAGLKRYLSLEAVRNSCYRKCHKTFALTLSTVKTFWLTNKPMLLRFIMHSNFIVSRWLILKQFLLSRRKFRSIAPRSRPSKGRFVPNPLNIFRRPFRRQYKLSSLITQISQFNRTWSPFTISSFSTAFNCDRNFSTRCPSIIRQQRIPLPVAPRVLFS